jgi:deoxyribodipyrimidine photolyase
MNKLSQLALIAALFALATPDTAAEAKMKIRLHDHDNRHQGDDKISCNTARHMVRERGFKIVRVKSCISNVYSFYAVRKGRTYIFYVDAFTRSLWREG